jgi:hypothetical protein
VFHIIHHPPVCQYLIPSAASLFSSLLKGRIQTI